MDEQTLTDKEPRGEYHACDELKDAFNVIVGIIIFPFTLLLSPLAIGMAYVFGLALGEASKFPEDLAEQEESAKASWEKENEERQRQEKAERIKLAIEWEKKKQQIGEIHSYKEWEDSLKIFATDKPAQPARRLWMAIASKE